MESPTGQVPGGEYGPSGTGVNVMAAPPGRTRPGRIRYLGALLAFVGGSGMAWPSPARRRRPTPSLGSVMWQ
jgi:hypothetical protein